MGIYSTNRFNSIGNLDLEPNLSYVGEAGVQLAMIEAYEEDLSLFNSIILKDFQEHGARLNGATEEEISAIQEGAISDFFERIKKFFMALIQKLKGIFHNFMAKFDSKVMKDSKAFHDKYQKDVYAKDLSRMKVKYSKPKSGREFVFDIGTQQPAVNKPCLSLTAIYGTDVDKLVEDFDRDEYVAEVLNRCSPKVNISSVNEYDKEVHEACFEDEDEVDNTEAIIREVGKVLMDSKKVESVRKANASLETAIGKIITDIEKSKKSITDAMVSKEGGKEAKNAFSFDRKGDGNYENGTKVNTTTTIGAGSGSGNKKFLKAIGYIQTQATAVQTASGKFTAAALREVKFEVAQARRVFAAAVAHNPKAVKESAELELAFQDEAEYEVMSAFDEM